MLNVDTDQFVSQALASGALVDDCNQNRSAMLSAAINAARNAYCPYSRFHVGAALLTVTADIYAGCNVENAGMSHAELTAITAAIVHEGPDMLIQEMVIWTPTLGPCLPCGVCSHAIREHVASTDIKIWSFCNDPTTPALGFSLAQLLPNSFGPENLQ